MDLQQAISCSKLNSDAANVSQAGRPSSNENVTRKKERKTLPDISAIIIDNLMSLVKQISMVGSK